MKQSTEHNPDQSVDFSLTELTELLIKQQNLHDGLYNLTVQFQIAVGAVGLEPATLYPGAMIGVTRIGLTKTEKPSAHTVDAAKVNPAPKKKAKKDKDKITV